MNVDNKKIALVTGGNTGIGKEICLKLARNGIHVIINYVSNGEEAFDLVKTIDNEGYSCECMCADVSSYEEAEKMVNEIKDKYGRCDILVNNAGITRDNLLMRMNEKDFDDVIRVNLKGTYIMTKLVSMLMLKNRFGRIVNMASVVGVSGNVGQANYSASKAGIIGFTKSIAKELAKKNITSNAVAPGFIKTRMTDQMTDAAKEETLKHIPLSRMGMPSDIANAVNFLVSEDASYITGQVLHVDGGMVM